jgi:hypothetical protein
MIISVPAIGWLSSVINDVRTFGARLIQNIIPKSIANSLVKSSMIDTNTYQLVDA